MVTLGSVVLKVSNIDRAAAFWSRALGYVPDGDPAFLAPPSGAGGRLHLDEDDRTHLDLWLADGEDRQAEVERLISLGATRVDWDYPEGADFVVLSDPDGNLFCVIGE
jgi:catechol 2,3-dioxygenase-like lactoylglutathione lyase family enzyme